MSINNKGRMRREYPDGTIVNTTKILSRSEKKHGRPGDNEQYYYNGECTKCGSLVLRRVWDMRNRKSCKNCPKKNINKKIAIKIFKDGKAWTN